LCRIIIKFVVLLFTCFSCFILTYYIFVPFPFLLFAVFVIGNFAINTAQETVKNKIYTNYGHIIINNNNNIIIIIVQMLGPLSIKNMRNAEICLLCCRFNIWLCWRHWSYSRGTSILDTQIL
jgi:hypothetical protein